MREHFEGKTQQVHRKEQSKAKEERKSKRDREKESSKPKLRWYANQCAYHQIRSELVISIMKNYAKRKGR